MGQGQPYYCKAYLLEHLRKFPGWKEKGENIEKRSKFVDREWVYVDYTEVEDVILFLYSNYYVCDTMYNDEACIVFNDVTPEWIEFCKNDLGFVIPERN